MATLTVKTIDRAGVDLDAQLVAADGVNGDDWLNTGKEFVVVKNADTASKTVTLDIIKTIDGQSVTDRTVTVAAGKTMIIGPFPVDTYNNPLNDTANGKAKITYDAVTSVTVGVFKLDV